MTAEVEKELAVLQERVDGIDKRTERIESKLDDAIACKADKTEVEQITKTQTDHDRAINRLYGAVALAAVLIPVITWLIDKL